VAQPRQNEQKYPFFVFAKLIEQVGPLERGERYETPLTAYLEERGLGTVSGGGCLLRDRAHPGEKDIEYAGIDIELANLNEALALTKSKLKELGAPAGSQLEYTGLDGNIHSEPIGELELLNIFVDNLSLAPEIYESADMEALCKGLSSALRVGGIGELRGPCIWPSEVLFYFVGPNADEIFERLEPLRKNYPILQNARVVFQRRDSAKTPIELRIAFNER
jgi:hypothetical protein